MTSPMIKRIKAKDETALNIFIAVWGGIILGVMFALAI